MRITQIHQSTLFVSCKKIQGGLAPFPHLLTSMRVSLMFVNFRSVGGSVDCLQRCSGVAKEGRWGHALGRRPWKCISTLFAVIQIRVSSRSLD